MNGINVRWQRFYRQAHPRRGPAELQRIGERTQLTHVGTIVAGIVGPLIARRELEKVLRSPAIVSIRIELRTEAVEMAA